MDATRTLRRTFRPIWIAAAGATLWTNRAHVRSALGFGKKPGPTLHIAPRTGPDERPVVRTITATEEVRSWE